MSPITTSTSFKMADALLTCVECTPGSESSVPTDSWTSNLSSSSSTSMATPTSTALSSITTANTDTKPILSATTPPLAIATPNPSTRANHEHTILLILIVVILLAALSFIVDFLVRRSHRLAEDKEKELEEGKLEVEEAREMRPRDNSLSKAYFPYGYGEKVDFENPGLDSPLTAGLAAPPLFHPRLGRSRTSPTERQNPIYPLARLTSYSNAQTTNFNGLPSSLSTGDIDQRLSHPADTNNKLMRSFTNNTMQTRRAETPPPLKLDTIFTSTPRGGRLERREVHSFWSFSQSSDDTSPISPISIYSPQTVRNPLGPSPTPRHGETSEPSPRNLARPAATFQPFSPAHYSPVQDYGQFTRPQQKASRSLARSESSGTFREGINPIFILQVPRTAQSPPPDYISQPQSPVLGLRRAKTTANMSLPPALRETRSPVPPIPSTADPGPTRLIIDAYSISSDEILPEEPKSKIERWLDGSTGTTSVFGSILDGPILDGNYEGEYSDSNYSGDLSPKVSLRRNQSSPDLKRTRVPTTPTIGIRRARTAGSYGSDYSDQEKDSRRPSIAGSTGEDKRPDTASTARSVRLTPIRGMRSSQHRLERRRAGSL